MSKFTSKMNELLSRGEFFGMFNKFIAAGAVTVTIAPFVYLFIYGGLGVTPLIPFTTTALSVCIGLVCQAFVGAINKTKRGESNHAYESNTKYFKPREAMISIIVAVALSFIAFKMTNSYMLALYRAGRIPSYDPYSLYPLLAALSIFIPTMAGIMIWFYPYDKIISSRTIFPFLAVHLISVMISYYFANFATVCFMLFLFFALLILNQSYLLGLVDRTRIGVVTPQMRLYNIALVCVVVLLVALFFVVVMSVVVGVVVLFRMFLFFALAAILRDDSTTYQKPDEVADAASSQFFADFGGIAGGSDSMVMGMYFVLFCILVFCTAVFFIIVRKVNLIKIFGDLLGRVYNAILSFIENLFSYARSIKERVEYFDYFDDEKKVDQTAYQSSKKVEFKARRTYRDFTHRLNSLKTLTEKTEYAYSTLVYFWRTMEYRLRASDSPREIGAKVMSRTELKNINEITSLYERTRYGGEEVESDILLGEMCAMIKKYYD